METLYSIGEAADILGISVPTIRLYEREGLIIPIRKKSRHRLYAQADLDRITCLRRNINEKKIGIAGMRRLLALIPCWKIHECKAPDRAACRAFNDDSTPCWMVTDRPVPCDKADCRNCPVYNQVVDCGALKRMIFQYTTDNG